MPQPNPASTMGAMAVIDWLQSPPLVERVLYPALADCPGHDIWKRFLGASGVFSIVFVPEAVEHVSAALDALETFAIGASWGGTRSLVAPMPVKMNRTATKWAGDDLVLRVSIGLEAQEDLVADLQRMLHAIEMRIATDLSRAVPHAEPQLS